MLEHFRQIHSLLRINNQALLDEILRVGASLNVVRELECTSFDLFVGLLDLLRLEGRSTMEHGIKDDADRPEIHLIAMAIASVKHLGCQIVWSATNGALALSIVKHLSCKSKVADLQAHAIGQEEISKFQISMDHLMRVNVLHCFN